MWTIIIGVLMLVIAFLIYDYNRNFFMPRSLDIVPAILGVVGAAAVTAGIFSVA